MSRYDMMITLPHHVSHRHPHMSMADRAAQFSPFAALTGYDAAVEETARLTDEKIELSEDRRAELDRKQQHLLSLVSAQPTVTVTFFVPDERKSGGSYRTITGQFKGINSTDRSFCLTDGTSIPLDRIYDLQSESIKEGSSII